ncbi:MAG: YfcC family protein, partial [Halomonas sp.]|nr:YfcC family protein [Halomonas sp.]
MTQTSETTQATDAKRRHWQIPHIYVILFVFIAIAAVATYFVPAGEFERIPGPDGRTTIDAESFQYVASNLT